MKKTLLAAALSLTAVGVAHAGVEPVVPGLPIVITTSITIPTPTTPELLPSFPIFFVITPPTSPGGAFTFTLKRGN